MKNQTVFIIEAAGTGKSSVLPLLQDEFPNQKIFDFDERGVPEFNSLEEGVRWRIKTTNFWLSFISEEFKEPVILCGLMFPSELRNSQRFSIYTNTKFILLTLEEMEISRRLKVRNWTDKMIKEHFIIQNRMIEEIKN